MLDDDTSENDSDNSADLLTPKQAAKRLSVSVDTLNGYVEDGVLEFVNLARGTKNKLLRFDPVDIAAFIRDRKRRVNKCRVSPKRKTASISPKSGSTVVGLVERLAAQAAATRKSEPTK